MIIFIFDLNNTLYSTSNKIKYNPLLNKYIKSLPGKKYIFSNNTKNKGNEILKKLKIYSLFSKKLFIDDFIYPKPHILAFKNAIKLFKINNNDIVYFIDDKLVNKKISHKFGWK